MSEYRRIEEGDIVRVNVNRVLHGRVICKPGMISKVTSRYGEGGLGGGMIGGKYIPGKLWYRIAYTMPSLVAGEQMFVSDSSDSDFEGEVIELVEDKHKRFLYYMIGPFVDTDDAF